MKCPRCGAELVRSMEDMVTFMDVVTIQIADILKIH